MNEKSLYHLIIHSIFPHIIIIMITPRHFLKTIYIKLSQAI